MSRRLYLASGFLGGAAAAAYTHPRTRARDVSFYDPDFYDLQGVVELSNPLNPLGEVKCLYYDTVLGSVTRSHDRNAAMHASLVEAVDGAVWPWRAFYGWLLGVK